ncbi:unnamed protein product [Heterobilharzia americana]|nr:unnamed protein product [Heterobilharzia americana]
MDMEYSLSGGNKMSGPPFLKEYEAVPSIPLLLENLSVLMALLMLAHANVQLVIHEIPVSWILDLQEGQVLFTWFESVILSVSLERNLSFLISKLYLDSFPPYRQLTFQGRRKMTNITAFNCFQLKS